jgi:hypothetical protein
MNITQTLIGHVAVDSGQIMIADPCYIEAGFNNQFDPDTKNQGEQPKYEMNYDGCCNATLSKRGFGQLGNEYTEMLGLACGTLYGDGVYPVYAEMKDGRVKSLTIDFDPRSDEDDDVCGNCGEELSWDCRCDDEEEE